MNSPSSDARGDGPRFQVGHVAQLVGLSPATLRAWERRYGVPGPGRGEQGYRFYSEADVRTLQWLKAQLEAGMTIGRAAALLAELRRRGQDPAAPPVDAFGPARALSLADLARTCGQAFRRLDEAAVVQCFQHAYGLYAFEDVMSGLIRPVMVEIGDDWAAGRLPVAVEHFASQQTLRQLWGMFSAAGEAWRPGTLLAGCAPGERHEIGLLMVAVRLRWRGWDVKYLGPELSFERLEEVVGQLQPRLLLFSATRAETARHLRGLATALAGRKHLPTVLLGGQGFAGSAGETLPAGMVVHTGPEDVVALVERLAVPAAS